LRINSEEGKGFLVLEEVDTVEKDSSYAIQRDGDESSEEIDTIIIYMQMPQKAAADSEAVAGPEE